MEDSEYANGEKIMPTIEIYTKKTCPYCVRAKQLLDHKKVTYTEIAVDTDRTVFDVMMKRSGGKRTVPQIFINNKSIGGCDDLYALNAAGKLDALLI